MYIRIHQDTLEYIGVHHTMALDSPLGSRSPSLTTYLQHIYKDNHQLLFNHTPLICTNLVFSLYLVLSAAPHTKTHLLTQSTLENKNVGRRPISPLLPTYYTQSSRSYRA